ncbi:MAG: malonyl-CoA synthase, partial [Alphaproteobacteria bacterium]|nr:malonyl-CoA synthase [Alphaproteobacteria bacterium]
MTCHLYDQFRQAMPNLDKLFIETIDGRKITYGEVETLSAQMANVLAQLGIKAGDRVAVQVEKSPDAILLYLACIRAGAIFLP